MKNPAYSEKQMKIITGEIPIDNVNGRTALALYNKAIANGDIALAHGAMDRVAKAKDEARVRNVERANKRNALLREGCFEWKQPKYVIENSVNKIMPEAKKPM